MSWQPHQSMFACLCLSQQGLPAEVVAHLRHAAVFDWASANPGGSCTFPFCTTTQGRVRDCLAPVYSIETCLCSITHKSRVWKVPVKISCTQFILTLTLVISRCKTHRNLGQGADLQSKNPCKMRAHCAVLPRFWQFPETPSLLLHQSLMQAEPRPHFKARRVTLADLFLVPALPGSADLVAGVGGAQRLIRGASPPARATSCTLTKACTSHQVPWEAVSCDGMAHTLPFIQWIYCYLMVPCLSTGAVQLQQLHSMTGSLEASANRS